MTEKAPLLAIIDGNNIMMKSHFAFLKYDLKNSEGLSTGALYGSILQHIKFVNMFDPTHIVWFFDSGGSNYRKALHNKYKGSRDIRPEITHQFGLFDKFLSLCNVTHYREHGVEADDLIAKACHEWGDISKVIVSADHDLRQLVNDNPKVTVYQPPNGGKDHVIWNSEKVRERYGIGPKGLAEAWALSGDKSDDIDGIPRVGEKTAIKMLKKYGSIDNVLQYDEKASPHKELVERNLKLIKLTGELAQMPITLQDCAFKKYFYEPKDVYDFLDKMGINSIKTRIMNAGLY